MSDRKALAREIAARTKPRFIEIKPESRSKAISEKGLKAIRGDLTAEEYRWLLIEKWGGK